MYRAMRIAGLLVACIIVSAQILPAKTNAEVTSPVADQKAEGNQRTTSISKATCPSAAQARIKAEKKNPGWKVVNIKEGSKFWRITMKKE